MRRVLLPRPAHPVRQSHIALPILQAKGEPEAMIAKVYSAAASAAKSRRITL